MVRRAGEKDRAQQTSQLVCCGPVSRPGQRGSSSVLGSKVDEGSLGTRNFSGLRLVSVTFFWFLLLSTHGA